MISKADFDALLRERETMVIDGALATELELRGCDLNHALWSAKILMDDPESIVRVHLDYFLAGADIAITASYQAAPQGLKEHFGMDEDETKQIIQKSVQLARNAREAALSKGLVGDKKLLVAGSVGPYGAYLADGSEYRGDYVRSSQELKGFHRPRIEALVNAGVDLLALETMPCMLEITALLELLKDDFPNTIAWLSCTVSSAASLSDKTQWTDVLAVVNEHKDRIIGFGINCVPMTIATESLKQIQELTDIPLVCYPNSGETWDAETKSWHGNRLDDTLEPRNKDMAADRPVHTKAWEWKEIGARLIGGCCRTGPAFIKTVCKDLENNTR